ncbi:MAG TPA: hypothetical protein PKX06_18705, partial [Phenylobacterium sp.]|nr:hypothetical protein [Phenylobacterium sp.]
MVTVVSGALAMAGSAVAQTMPSPSRELVRVGADTLMDRPLGKKKDQAGVQIPLLSERLDGCL